MSYENKSGLNVNNQYGARDTGGAVGVEHSQGSKRFLRIDLTGQSVNDSVNGFVPPVSLPKGAKFVAATLRVDEAFSLGGTTPTVQIGAAGSVATNGIVLSKTELEAIGTKVPSSTGAGTWSQSSSTGTTAAAKVAYALGGTSPTVSTSVGKGTLILEYIDVAKA